MGIAKLLGTKSPNCIGQYARILPVVLAVQPEGIIVDQQITQSNFHRIQPLQQRLVAGAVEGAAQKKLSFSREANSAKASAMPSGVREPSWSSVL